MVLERAGTVVVTAGSAREAIEALSKARPDVLVSDLGMPEQDGLDLIRQLRHDGHDARDLPGRRANRVCPEGTTHTWRSWPGSRSTCPSPPTRTN